MHPIDLSSHVIDTGEIPEMLNRVTNELTELDTDLAIVESFSHSVVFDTGEGLVVTDASGALTGEGVVAAMRGWSNKPVSDLIYTHGHADHVGGSFAFAADAANRGSSNPMVLAHRNVARRIDRYNDTNLWNVAINQRQFGGVSPSLRLGNGQSEERFLPVGTLRPNIEFDESLEVMLGGTPATLHHARGETDDHLWVHIPSRKWIFSGDFIIWNYPNAGNPQKVQRYALEWAAALRRMIAQEPEMLVPAHGLPIVGKERIAKVLDDTASTLEFLVREVVTMMNDGATLDTIIHSVKVPDEVLQKPYLRPIYDEPEYAVRNIWRLYGGWWDGAASRLKPAPDAVVGAEVAQLAGGAGVLIARALEISSSDIRLACHLADFAVWAEPDNATIHAGRAEIYQRRRDGELSLMSKGIFAAAARESNSKAGKLN